MDSLFENVRGVAIERDHPKHRPPISSDGRVSMLWAMMTAAGNQLARDAADRLR
jgi:hypothetical protein